MTPHAPPILTGEIITKSFIIDAAKAVFGSDTPKPSQGWLQMYLKRFPEVAAVVRKVNGRGKVIVEQPDFVPVSKKVGLTLCDCKSIYFENFSIKR